VIARKQTSRTTKQTTKRKSATSGPHVKRRRVVSPRESDSDDNDAEVSEEEIDDTPLTEADIPTIVEAVLSSLPTEDSAPTDDDNQDAPHLGKQL